jgi:serine/threonine-protein kinase
MQAQPMRCPTCDARFDAASMFCTHDGARLVPAGSDADALIGTVLAERYQIVKLIGEGGMGRVYAAQHVNINKKLAIKVLRPEVTAVPSTVSRFRQEARSASSIGHENIIEIEDFATLPDGTVYLAMEMLEGESLGERMRQQPGPALDESAWVMIQVGRGLAAAHEKGIVHRDMKPENVFLARKHGRIVPKILDFGIAKVSDAERGTHVTQPGAIFGTPLYMSPEQAMGQPLDHRTDIYSVGVILYELACGRVPFKADSAVQVLSQHITMQPETPSKAAPARQIPPALDALILKAIAKEPAQRFANMAELVAALEALPVEAPASIWDALTAVSQPRQTSAQAISVGAPSQAPVAAVQQKSKAPFYAVAALLLSILAGGAWLATRKPEPPVQPAPVQPAPVKVEPKLLDVLVSTTPPGAKVLREGRTLAETPDAIKLPPGETWDVVLHKDGYVDQEITLDPARDRKMLVKLAKKVKPATAPAETTTPEPPKPEPPKPASPPKPSDPVGAAVEQLAHASAPGTKRMGNFYAGHGNDSGQHSDWWVTLEAGRCYDFVTTGGAGVERIYAYLWGPRGRRVTDRGEGSPGVTLHYCANAPGSYHFQAKLAGGKGDFKMGIYSK